MYGSPLHLFSFLPFNRIQQAALLDNILDKGRERLRLIGLSCGNIGNDAGIKIHVYLIPRMNLLRGLVTFQNCQSDIDSIAVENTGKGGGNHAGNPGSFDSDGRVDVYKRQTPGTPKPIGKGIFTSMTWIFSP